MPLINIGHSSYAQCMQYDYFVYMLRCSDGKYYVGITNDVQRRLSEHQNGLNQSSFTFKRRPVQLVYSGIFHDVWEAIRWEKQLKGWSRNKKEALIVQDQKLLEWFSKRSGVRKKANSLSC